MRQELYYLQAVESLTKLLSIYKDNAGVRSSWLEGVLPSIMDREATAQELCANRSYDVVFAPILRNGNSHETLLGLVLEVFASRNE